MSDLAAIRTAGLTTIFGQRKRNQIASGNALILDVQAGKTAAIRILTDPFLSARGDALIYGRHVRFLTARRNLEMLARPAKHFGFSVMT